MKDNVLTHLRSELEQQSTGALDAMLQAEVKKQTPDGVLVRMILEVLQEREADFPVQTDAQVEAAVEKYCAYSWDVIPTKPAKRRGVWLKVASVLLVLGVLLFALPQAVQAEGFLDMLARWSESVFAFFSPGSEKPAEEDYEFSTDHPGLQQVYDAVTALGITDPVVPMWIPQEYELAECRTVTTPMEEYVYARFVDNDKEILIEIKAYADDTMHEYYKDENIVKVYEMDGINHYVVQNIDRWVVLWKKDSIGCALQVDCQEDALYEILKSIYTVEDN